MWFWESATYHRSFSWYAQAISTRNEIAKTTTRVFFDHYIVHYGFPARIHSDEGANFESHVLTDPCAQSQGSRSLEQRHTIRWVMVRWRGLTKPFYKCWEHLRITRKVIGKHTSPLWSTPTTPLFMIAPDTHLISWCLGATPGWRAMLFWV